MFPINKQDRISPPSSVGIAGLFTDNGSLGLAVGGKLYFKEDRYRLNSALGTAHINAGIYGVGILAGNRGTFVPLKIDGNGLISEFLYGFRKGVFVVGQIREVFRALLQPGSKH